MAGSGLPRDALIAAPLAALGVRVVADRRRTAWGRAPRPAESLVRSSGLDDANVAAQVNALGGARPLALVAHDGAAWLLNEWSSEVVVAGTGDPTPEQQATLDAILSLLGPAPVPRARRRKPADDADEAEPVEQAEAEPAEEVPADGADE